MQTTVNGTTTLTAYIGSIEEVQTTGSTTTTTTYDTVQGKRMAGKVDGSLYSFGYDALGSQVVVLNASGNLVGSQLYGPYGNSRSSAGTLPTSIGFTGQRADSVTGLDYYVARYYDPVVGQFLSADVVQGNAQGMDPYAYVGENPETRTDPTGHWGWLIGGLIAVGVASVTGDLPALVGGLGAEIAYITSPHSYQAPTLENFLDGMGAAVLGGIVSGALGSPLGNVVGSGLGTAVGDWITNQYQWPSPPEFVSYGTNRSSGNLGMGSTEVGHPGPSGPIPYPLLPREYEQTLDENAIVAKATYDPLAPQKKVARMKVVRQIIKYKQNAQTYAIYRFGGWNADAQNYYMNRAFQINETAFGNSGAPIMYGRMRMS